MKNKFIISEKTTFEDAIRALDANGQGFLVVTGDCGLLIGILTDGDIRRAILNKKNKLEDIINRKPFTLNIRTPRKQAIQYLKSIHRRQLPLIDDENKLVDVIILDHLEFNSKPNNVIIMAGGYGTRLGHLTKNMPKPMLSMGNKPLLEHILTNCYNQGFSNIYISVNYKSEVIKNYFKDGSAFGVRINYLDEKDRLGTAGSLSLIREDFCDPFIVINGDIFTALSFDELLNYHIESSAYATMCVREIQHQIPYGIVELGGDRVISIHEKPTHSLFVNAGIYVFNPQAKSLVPHKQYFDMPSLFNLILQNKLDVHSYKVTDYWVDIGEIKNYESAKKDLQDQLII
ncbi:MAG: nucleotidyltransferase family protein [Gammaproteobacteria bacterium]|nr:nucleotidyltransferase family protein [Gammaproteobacteria bacterium]